MKRKILIVEDNDDCRELLAMCIKRLGYEVCEAVTGIEAIEQASAMHPDLIMMDLNLPEMSGAKATALLKANPGTTDIPVIVNPRTSPASKQTVLLKQVPQKFCTSL
ncbi:MAG TPA: response regulator [Candidatus Udaeobacter sp.]|nr:response regulator [Candidatus Udaeobacter sp.]